MPRSALRTVTIDCPHNEASALVGVQNDGLRQKYGWDVAFWALCDEKPAGEALAVLGRHDGRWKVLPLRARLRGRGASKRAEDAETLARAGSWLYVFGSQYGAKEGPLQPRRHFVLRFNEALVRPAGRALHAEAELARRPFFLHRLINDALREMKLACAPVDPKVREALVEAARTRAKERGKRWRGRVRDGDLPVNVEGATFVAGGNLLLGLRYPVARGGHPILVELEGIDRLFEPRAGRPEVVALHVLREVGTASAPAGIRELDHLDGVVHAIVGNLERDPERSVVLRAHPEASRRASEHWVAPFMPGQRGLRRLKAWRVRRFTGRARVEGLAIEAGRAWYVQDAEKIVLGECELPALTPPRRPGGRSRARAVHPRPRRDR